MNKEQRPKDTSIRCGLVEERHLLSFVAVERFEYVRPPICRLKGVEGVFEIVQEPTYPPIEAPEKNRSNHASGPNQPENHRVHGAKFNRGRCGEQNTKHNKIVIETSDPLIGYHVEMPPSTVVLFKDRHGLIFLHNVEGLAPATGGAPWTVG